MLANMDNTAPVDKTFQIITIVAIVVGPILALWAQRILDHFRESRKRKLTLLQSLLSSRASPVSLVHVQALNSIELEFYPRRGKNTKVIDAWRIYIDHLNHPEIEDPHLSQTWNIRRQELIVELLHEMSKSLGYELGKEILKRDGYYPLGWTKTEEEQTALRQAAVKVFEGKEPLRVRVDA